MVVLPFSERLTEHSWNKIITNFETKDGPGVLQSSVQQALLQEFQTTTEGHRRKLDNRLQFV